MRCAKTLSHEWLRRAKTPEEDVSLAREPRNSGFTIAWLQNWSVAYELLEVRCVCSGEGAPNATHLNARPSCAA